MSNVGKKLKTLILFVGLYLVLTSGNGQPWTWPTIAPSKVTQVTYVYEQRDGSPPPAVQAALAELNKGDIVASPIDKDALDGTDQVPEQYKIAIAAAKTLPSLVVQAGETVKRVVEKPTTYEQVMEAAK